MSELKMFQIGIGPYDRVIAKDQSDALLVLRETYGSLDGLDTEKIRVIGDDEDVPLLAEEEADLPSGAEMSEQGHWRKVLKAREWIDRDGRGFFASTEW